MNRVILGLVLFLTNQLSWATQPQVFSYSGALKDGKGNVLSESIAILTTTILSPAPGNCVLFEENHLNVSPDVSGNFSIQVGTGTKTGRDSGSSLVQVFSNAIVIPSTNCTSGYTPIIGDQRFLHISITLGSVATDLSPDLAIGSVPSALVAETSISSQNSQTLQGFSPTDLALPAGMIIPFYGVFCPTGFLTMDGTHYEKSQFVNLSNVVGNDNGDGTFTVPDWRGQFIRGLDTTGNVDPERVGAAIGSYQGDQFRSHMHVPSNGSSFLTQAGQIPSQNANLTRGGGSNDFSFSTAYTGGSETRPKNVAASYCIKD